MATEVKLPPIADGVEKGDVVNVLVKEGDEIAPETPLIEVESDKATLPVPSPVGGKVTKLLVKAGDKVAVGQAIAVIDEGGAGAKQEKAEKEEKEKKTEPAKGDANGARKQEEPAPKKLVARGTPKDDRPILMDEPPPPSGPASPPARHHAGNDVVPAGPAVRRIARELGIDLTQVSGSGRNGRILVEDLDSHIQQYVSGRGGSGGPGVAPVALPDFSKWGAVRVVKAESIRRKIAEKMVQSWATVPHVHHHDEADITDLMAMQKRYKERVKEQGGNLTLTPFLMKAVVMALKEFPTLNASYDAAKNEIIHKDYYHIGVAVETEAGLIVPVVRDVDQKLILQLATEMNDIAERTRERKVSPDELKGGTFTISNLGGIGGGHFNPIINTPESAILGVGRAKKKPAFAADGSVTARMMLPITLGYDHRVIDGADGARFVVRVVEVLENFEATILGL